MGKPTGFMEYERKNGPVVPPSERVKNFNEFHGSLNTEEQCKQGARCMECVVPFCQAGTVDFLKQVTKTLLDTEFQHLPYELAKDKHVLVIGGGDTGNDCVGTSIRLGAKSVTQLEMMPMPPKERTASNPWPEWPKVLKTDYGQEEAIMKLGPTHAFIRQLLQNF